MRPYRPALSSLCFALVLVAPGCFGGSQSASPSSGDPEADNRASMRMGTEEDNSKDDKNKARTLYERLGGNAGLVAIVDDLTARSIADPRVNFERKAIKTNWLGDTVKPWPATPDNIERFKHHMVEFLSVATGGPTEYTGRDVHAAHKGMKISNNQFDAMVGDIKTSMDKLGIATREKRDLLAVFETTRKQVVEKP